MTQKHWKSGLKIALYEPDIPQNTAAIIRTCSCMVAYLEIIEPCGFLFNDKRFRRISMDYLDENMIRYYKSVDDFFEKKVEDRVILMTTKAKMNYTDFKFRQNDTILFGRESAGVPEELHKKLNIKLKIPMVKNKRSLNLATSVAITLAESLRQINIL